MFLTEKHVITRKSLAEGGSCDNLFQSGTLYELDLKRPRYPICSTEDLNCVSLLT